MFLASVKMTVNTYECYYFSQLHALMFFLYCNICKLSFINYKTTYYNFIPFIVSFVITSVIAATLKIAITTTLLF